MSMTLIQEQVLGSAAPSVTFGSIPQGYTDLVLEVVGSMTVTSNMQMRFNGDTGANYSRTQIVGNGSSAVSSQATNESLIYVGSTAAGVVGLAFAEIFSYANTGLFKTVLTRDAGGAGNVVQRANLWRSNVAITSILLFTDGTTFDANCIFRLWGIK